MSLSRQLEPEVMDSPAEALAYDAMDHSEVNRLFVSDFLAANPFPAWDPENEDPPLVLDIGTGTALIPIELCRQQEGVRVRGIDLAVAMLDQARLNIEMEGLIERIHLAHDDAKDLPYEDGAFAGVISNSIIHHIPEPLAVLAEAVRVCQPGGLIFIRDLKRPDNQAELDHLVTTYAAEADDEQRKMFADSLHAALTTDEVAEMLGQLQLPTDGLEVTSDRHWTLTLKKSAD